jgi:hypothetical protein
MGTSLSVTGAGQRIARQSTPNVFWWSPGGCARWWNRTPAGKPIASLLRLPLSKRVFQQINDPKQGARLVRAFLRITDPMVRLAIVHVVEKIGQLLLRIVS